MFYEGSKTAVTCTAPPGEALTKVKLSLSLDGGDTYTDGGYYYYHETLQLYTISPSGVLTVPLPPPPPLRSYHLLPIPSHYPPFLPLQVCCPHLVCLPRRLASLAGSPSHIETMGNIGKILETRCKYRPRDRHPGTRLQARTRLSQERGEERDGAWRACALPPVTGSEKSPAAGAVTAFVPRRRLHRWRHQGGDLSPES